MAAVAGVHGGSRVLGRAAGDQDRVVGVRLDMLLKILRALERLAAKIALVRLERHMDADVRRDVVALDGRGAAVLPLASEVEVIGALATDVDVADVVLGGSASADLRAKGGKKKRIVDRLT